MEVSDSVSTPARDPKPAAAPRRLAGAAAIMMAAFVASRATGVLRDVAITAQFGTGHEIAAYLAAIRIPDFIFQVTAGGAVASAFIPVFTGYLARDELDDGWRMVSTLFNLSIVVLSPLIVLAMVFAPEIMRLQAPEFAPEYQELAGQLARILLISPLFFTLGTFATGVLNSHHRFFLAALAPTSYNLGIIAGALVFAPRFGIRGLALGAALGSCLFLLSQVPGLGRVGMRYRAVIDLAHAGVREVGRLMVPRAIGLAVVQVNFLVATYLASGIAGGIPALNWGWQLTMLPLGVFGMAISSAVFPSLAALTARSEMDELRRTVSLALRFILFLTIPATVGLILLGEPIVGVLFERGAFTAASTAMVAHALRLYAPGLIAMATVEIVTRVFYAFHDTRTPVAVAVAAMLVNVLLAVALVRPLSYGGLALATALSSIFEAGALVVLIRRRLPGVLDRGVLTSIGQSVVAALVMGTAVFGVGAAAAGVLAAGTLAMRLLAVGGAVGAGVVVYLAASLLLGSEEAGRLRQALGRRS